MKYKILVVIGVVATMSLMMSCNTREMQGITKQHDIAFVNDKNSKIELDDIFEDFSVIKLDCKKNALLSRIGRFYIANNRFYMFDNSSLPNIVMFDLNGDYIANVGAQGHAKGEYISLRDVCVSADGKSYALSFDNSIIVYDKNGKYIKTISLSSDTQYSKIVCCGDYFVLYSRHKAEGSEYVLSFYDKSFNYIGNKIPNLNHDFKVGPFVANPLLSNKNEICFFDFYRNQFYISNIKDLENTELLDVKTNNTYREEETVSGKFDEHFYEYDFIDKVYLSDDYIYGFITINKIYQYYEYNKKTHETKASIYGDITPLSFCYHNGYYYAVFSADKLSEYQKVNHRNHFRTRLCDALDKCDNNINPMDNFYLIRMKHKRSIKPQN